MKNKLLIVGAILLVAALMGLSAWGGYRYHEYGERSQKMAERKAKDIKYANDPFYDPSNPHPERAPVMMEIELLKGAENLVGLETLALRTANTAEEVEIAKGRLAAAKVDHAACLKRLEAYDH